MAPSRVRIPPSPLAQCPPRLCAHPRRGGRAVECGGLENRYPSLGGSRVQIPPPPPLTRLGIAEAGSRLLLRFGSRPSPTTTGCEAPCHPTLSRALPEPPDSRELPRSR